MLYSDKYNGTYKQFITEDNATYEFITSVYNRVYMPLPGPPAEKEPPPPSRDWITHIVTKSSSLSKN